MRKVLLSVCLLTLCLPVFAKNGAELMKDLTRVLPNDSLPLSLLYLNDTTLPLMFQPPDLYVMRARAREASQFYVQGTAKKAVTLDTTNFTIEQGGESLGSVPINVKHFEKGNVAIAKNDRVDGVLVFSKLIDVTQPFTVKHGQDAVRVEFTKDQLKEMSSAAPK